MPETETLPLLDVGQNDWNLSPGRYVSTADAEEHRDIKGIIHDLATAQAEAAELDIELNGITKSLGYQPYN
jgi:type I restriction-modification system DNA methylase subunit